VREPPQSARHAPPLSPEKNHRPLFYFESHSPRAERERESATSEKRFSRCDLCFF
jgi:hypothetical protein